MNIIDTLYVGDTSNNGQITIVDKDRLCYLVRSESKGAKGLRTISKAILEEFVNYLKTHPETNSNDARNALSGKSEIDKFEYGYVSTILQMAKMVLDKKLVVHLQLQDASLFKSDKPLQQIYYGAPGTGKSHEIKKQTEGKHVIRTTFHPDSDYSTFVGAYKPTTIEVPMRDVTGKVIVEDGEPVTENRIVYEFVQQSFLQAYTKAWKKYASATNDGKKPEEVYLVIEEINRGNCAQIFGDLFQLLDRGDNGFSEYPINADKDMRKQLAKAFTDMAFLNAPAISGMSAEQVALKIRNGEILLLPNNLYIWATMNTSDQSLFTIDSAFKRRWDWQYVPISDAGKKWKISVNGMEYDWWSFIEQINNKIWDATHSDDKKLGYFFCKADRKVNENDEENMIISADKFVGKVLFYIYNDVFKDYGFDDAIFKDKEDDNSDLLFQCYFKANGKPNEEKIEVFLKNLEVKLASEVADSNKDSDDNQSEDQADDPGSAEGFVAPASTFKVQLDGEAIEGVDQFDTYLAALKKMGMDKVEEIAAEKEYYRYDCPFVSKEQFDAIKEKENFSYVEADGYQVIKGINKKGMSNFLKLCAEKLGHSITIE